MPDSNVPYESFPWLPVIAVAVAVVAVVVASALAYSKKRKSDPGVVKNP